MAKKKAAATPDYINPLSDPTTAAAIQQYFAPGGQFYQSLSGAPGSEMMPTGQGGYVPNPTYVDPTQTQQQPISYPITTAPIQTQAPPAAPPTPPPPPPPPAAQMNWSGLASSLQGLLAPYLSGQSNPAAAGAGSTVTPTLMNYLAQYLGTLQPTQAGQQAAASQTPLGTQTTPQASMNWTGLQNMLQSTLAPYMSGASPATAGAGQNIQGQLYNQMLGYLGTMPSAQTNPTNPVG